MFGLLNVNKPAGMTSRDVVNRVLLMVEPDKCGHAGTLDPMATGVLLVTIGQATRLEEFLHRLPKRYLATFQLGRKSDTEDVTGSVEELPNAPVPTEKQLRAALASFVGEIDQVPPAYSALKVDGRRAYQLARKGKEVSLAPRKVQVHGIDLVSYAYPELVLDIRCGSGTYVRSLGRDIARAVGTEAVLSALVRTAIGPFRAQDAVSLTALHVGSLPEHLRPPQLGLPDLPQLTLSPDDLRRIANGQMIDAPAEVHAAEVAALDPQGTLVAILKPNGDGRLAPDRYFPPSAPAAPR
jgi:tRNA pseudouridine55 synthase